MQGDLAAADAVLGCDELRPGNEIRTNISTLVVVGLPRSGTTLLAYLLAGATGALALSEPFLVQSVVSHRRLNRYFARVKKSAALKFGPNPPKGADGDEFLRFLEKLAVKNQFSSLIVKETFRAASGWENIALLNELARCHQVAAIIRHPFDVAVSTIRAFHWCRGTIGRLLRLWAPGLPLFSDRAALVKHVGHNWMGFARWCKSNAAVTIRYEDLVEEPNTHVATLCDSMGLARKTDLVDGGLPRVALGGIGDPVVIRRPKAVHSRSVNRADLLSSSDREMLAMMCDDLISDWGYLPTGATRKALN